MEDIQQLTVLAYGANRSGKTRHSSTWPRPIYFVPQSLRNEMRSIEDVGCMVAPFGDMNDFANLAREVSIEITAGRKVGEYVPKTVILDSITSAQQIWEEEIKARRKIDKLEWGDWGLVKTALSSFLTDMRRCGVHIIFITHAKVLTFTTTVAGQKQEEHQGGFTIDGSARQFIPDHCDLVLYFEVTDRGGALELVYKIHARKKGFWPAGCRIGRIHKDKPLTVLQSSDTESGHPSYDDLAPYFGLPSADEDWDTYLRGAQKQNTTSNKTPRR